MRRFHRTYSLIPTLIATALFAVPEAAPCLASRFERAEGTESQTEKPCCAGCAEEAPRASTPAESGGHTGCGSPCSCPPWCPIPCGCGKIPCPPTTRVVGMLPLGPAGVLLHLATHPPAKQSPDGPFHPPRV